MAAIPLEGHLGKYLLLKATVRDRSTGATNVFYPAGSFSRSTRFADTPAHTYIPGLLSKSLNFGASFFTGADPVKLSNSGGTGVLDMVDLKQELEYLHDYSWDNADLEIFRGDFDALYSAWSSVAKLTATDLIGNQNLKRIRLRDAAWRLQCPVHNKYYLGTGGIEGGANLTGQWKPYLLGYGNNLPAIQIDTANQIFQFTWTSSAVSAVRHGGIPLTFDANYASYALLAAATVPTGKYATCEAQGLVRPNVTLTRSIRVDAQGDFSTQNGQTTPYQRAQIARRVATCYGDTNYADSGDLDTASFSAVASAHTAFCGWFWDKEISKANALTEIMSGILGYWYLKANGKLAIGYLRDPSLLTADTIIPYKDYGMSTIEMIDMISPRAVTKIGYLRNYGPEDISSLASGVNQDDAIYYGSESLWYTRDTKAAIQAIYPTAQTVQIQGNFQQSTDAQAEANRQHTIFSVPRRRYRWSMEIDIFADILDQPIQITGVNQLSLGSSKQLLCVGVDGVGFGPLTTDWWG